MPSTPGHPGSGGPASSGACWRRGRSTPAARPSCGAARTASRAHDWGFPRPAATARRWSGTGSDGWSARPSAATMGTLDPTTYSCPRAVTSCAPPCGESSGTCSPPRAGPSAPGTERREAVRDVPPRLPRPALPAPGVPLAAARLPVPALLLRVRRGGAARPRCPSRQLAGAPAPAALPPGRRVRRRPGSAASGSTRRRGRYGRAGGPGCPGRSGGCDSTGGFTRTMLVSRLNAFWIHSMLE